MGRLIAKWKQGIFGEAYYYPFGLTMAGISSKAAGGIENKKKYNGIEFDNDLDINTYEAFFRNLDPQTGRWWEIDPEIENGMENVSPYSSMYDDPILKSDFLGNVPEDCHCCPGAIELWRAVVQEAAKDGPIVAKPVIVAGAVAVAAVALSEIVKEGANAGGGIPYPYYIPSLAEPKATTETIPSQTYNEAIKSLGLPVLPTIVPPKSPTVVKPNVPTTVKAEHTNNARPSTKQQHQIGKARAEQDRNGAKGMTEPPRRRPPNHKGPWPPKAPPPPPPPPPPVVEPPKSQ